MKKLGLSALSMLVLALAVPSAARADIKIVSFQAGGIMALASGGGSNSFSPQLAWTPTFELGPFGLRGEIGAALFKDAASSSFLVLNYEALLQMNVFPKIGIEVGGGLQNWKGNGGSAGVISAGMTVGLMGTVDRVYATYSRFLLGTGLNEIKLGLGLVF